MPNNYIYRAVVTQQAGGNFALTCDDPSIEATFQWAARAVEWIIRGTRLPTGSPVRVEVNIQKYNYVTD